MMAGPSNDKCGSSVVCSNDPPPLSITLKKKKDLPKKLKHWSIDHLPVDILLLTVEDCELLACYHYLRNPFKSYEKSIGNVYFGKMGEDEDGSVKVAIVRFFNESSDPGGSQTTAKHAVTLLKPKATFLVGFYYSLNPNKAQLGDVVISSKLTTDFNKTPVSRDVGKLVKSAADGWEAPLANPEAREVNVCDGEILSCSDLIDAEQQCQLHPGTIAAEMEGKGENYSQGYSCFTSVTTVQKNCFAITGITCIPHHQCDFMLPGSLTQSWPYAIT